MTGVVSNVGGAITHARGMRMATLAASAARRASRAAAAGSSSVPMLPASDPRDAMLEHCLIALLAVLCPLLLLALFREGAIAMAESGALGEPPTRRGRASSKPAPSATAADDSATAAQLHLMAWALFP